VLILTRDRKNVLILATCQMLFGAARALIVVSAPLIAYAIADEKGLATLPHALVIVGTAIATIPASMLMRRVGRRMGFIIGTLIAAVGGVICVIAVGESHFWLFSLGTLMFGFSAGFAQLYRFAAADVAAPDFKPMAISLVLAGGVIAGFVGPELAKLGKDMIGSVAFQGSYMLLVGVTLLTGVVVAFVDIPGLTEEEAAAPRRPMTAIMRQPVFIVSVLAAASSQAVMNLLMTATPIAMAQANHDFAATALVIQWHSFGMFAPGFFTGHLIRRWGETGIILAGLVLTALSIAVALAGQSVLMFWVSMALLGLGWNFAFTAGSSLLLRAHTPSERAKTQGAVNFIIYGVAAVAALSSGALLHFFGWEAVSICALPLIGVAALVTLWYGWTERRLVLEQGDKT